MLSHIGNQLPRRSEVGSRTLQCSSEGSLPLEPSLWSPATWHVSRVEPRFSLHVCAHFDLCGHYPSHPSLSQGFKPNPGLRKLRVCLWDNISYRTCPSEVSVVQATLVGKWTQMSPHQSSKSSTEVSSSSKKRLGFDFFRPWGSVEGKWQTSSNCSFLWYQEDGYHNFSVKLTHLFCILTYPLFNFT